MDLSQGFDLHTETLGRVASASRAGFQLSICKFLVTHTDWRLPRIIAKFSKALSAARGALVCQCGRVDQLVDELIKQ